MNNRLAPALGNPMFVPGMRVKIGQMVSEYSEQSTVLIELNGKLT